MNKYTITASELQNNFEKYLDLAINGDQVIITQEDKEVACLMPKRETKFKLELVEETFSTATLETDQQHQEHLALPYHALYENKYYELDISYPPTYAYDMMHNNINPTLIVPYHKRKKSYFPVLIKNDGPWTHASKDKAYTIQVSYNRNLSTRELYELAFEIIDEFNACICQWFPEEKCLDWDVSSLLKDSRKFI